jgi:membrane associated rhomboid family serine protease
MPEISPYNQKFRFLYLPALFVVLIWLVFGIDWLFELNLAQYAVEPRTFSGLVGLLTCPLLHGDLEHIAANSVSLFVLLVAARYIFPQIFLQIFVATYLFPGLITWFIGRPALHLGASGMIYALAAFMFISGVIRVNRYLLAVSLLVVFLYGSLFWGLFPIEQSISWEGHLGGALTGFFLALWYRKEDPVEDVQEHEPEWDDDEPDFDDWKDDPDTTENGYHIKYYFKESENTKKKDD